MTFLFVVLTLDFTNSILFGDEVKIRSFSRLIIVPSFFIFKFLKTRTNKYLYLTIACFLRSVFQKSERDFAFVIDKSFKVGLLEKLIKEVDENIIQKVVTFDVFEGENIPKDKKSDHASENDRQL